MIDFLSVLRGFEGLSLVVGSIVAVLSFRAYLRTRSRSLVFLGVGFLLVSLAAALAGLIFEVFTHDLLTAWTVSASFDAAGFLVILYSILERDAGSAASPPPAEAGAGPPG